MSHEKEPLLVVVGPTASGKSELALELSERLGGEIISADSIQVYRYFDVGSGKPSAADRARTPHHGIDVLDPSEEMDAARFSQLAATWIGEVRARGKLPIVCGGTFLWVRALLFGLAKAPGKDDAIRERHRRIAEAEGRAALHAMLRSVDAASAERLSPNDFVRVSRALEVHELTGTPLSTLQREHGFQRQRYAARYVGIAHDAEALSARIRARAEAMLRAGWRSEVSELRDRGYRASRPMCSVGYRQVLAAVESETLVTDETLLDEIIRATRIFARRQKTWLRDQPVHWLSSDEFAAKEVPNELVQGL